VELRQQEALLGVWIFFGASSWENAVLYAGIMRDIEHKRSWYFVE